MIKLKLKSKKIITLWTLVLSLLLLTSCESISNSGSTTETVSDKVNETITLENLPEFSDQPYVELNGNQPEFTEDELKPDSYEFYSELDELGRCGVAEACIGTDIMPTEKRGAIGQVKPSGWHTIKYDVIDGLYLYNRCHLIGYQLAGENANRKNLITGTRYLNVTGMLPFEDLVADYVKETDSHVMYRVTPIFEGDNLVASGVQMEGKSVEDGGEDICFNVYVYNNQPGISIDYATGESWKTGEKAGEAVSEEDQLIEEEFEEGEETYIVNTGTHKFHKPDCSSLKDTKPQNKKERTIRREELIEQGYDPCGRCKP